MSKIMVELDNKEIIEAIHDKIHEHVDVVVKYSDITCEVRVNADEKWQKIDDIRVFYKHEF